VIVGAPFTTGLSRPLSGAAYVAFGKTPPGGVDLGALGSGGIVANGPSELDNAGNSVAGVGDVNGDGRPDVIVGDLQSDDAFVVYGFGPPELAYDQLAGLAGMPIARSGPATVRRTGPASFSVTPALPAGLSLDPSDGTITGTPKSAQPLTTYTVAMTDLTGTTTATLSIEINAVGVTAARTTPPRLGVSGRRRQLLVAHRRLAVRASCDEPCMIMASGSVRIAGTRTVIRLRPARGALAAPGSTTLALSLGRAAHSRLRHLLSRRVHRPALATIAVRATDAAGRTAQSQITIVAGG
jgi:hypothetical protein